MSANALASRFYCKHCKPYPQQERANGEVYGLLQQCVPG